MQCDSCNHEAVISQQYSGRHLCYLHLAADLEAKAKRSIRTHHWLATGDKIGVVVTGDKKGGALLHVLKKLTGNRRDVCLVVIPADKFPACEGDRSTPGLIAACLGIPCMESGSKDSREELSEKNGGGADTMPQHLPGKNTGHLAGLTKIAVAVTLEDVASGVLATFLRGRLETLPQAISEKYHAVPVICPFSAIPEAEAERYWDGLGYEIECPACSRIPDIFSGRVRTLLEDYTSRHPATYHALLNLGEQLTAGKGALLAGTLAGDPVPGGINGICRLLPEAKGNGA
jgi:tRNA(Ile)-lysidine synthase TilS/MesJ